MTVLRPRGTRDGRRRLGFALAVITGSTGIILGVVAIGVYAGTLLAAVVGLVYPAMLFVVFLRRDTADLNPGFEKGVGGWLAGMAAVAFAAYLAGVPAWHNLVLSSGRNVRAEVRDVQVEHTIHGPGKRLYTLVSPRTDDVIPGGALEQRSDRFEYGDVITVRVDPAGRVAPELPGEADSPAMLLAFLGLNAVIDGIVLWSVRRPRRPHRPGVLG